MSFDVRCGDCGAPMALRSGTYGPFWGCTRWPACAGVHGAHPDGRPLGTPADAATRCARIQAHEAFDRLWRGEGRLMSRHGAYRWMQRALGLAQHEAHIGLFSVAQCERLIAAVAAMRRRSGVPS